MFILEAIHLSTDNLLARYSARFRANPHGEGYLFNKDDFGEGLPCTTEQYEAYLNEFEDFVKSKTHFMYWWLLAVIIMAIISFAVMAIYFPNTVFLKDNDMAGNIAGGLMLLPLIFILIEGAKLYKKPEEELYVFGEIGRERQSREIIMNRRYKGMSWGMIFIGLIFSLLGLYFDLTNYAGGYDSPYMKYFFVFISLGLLWFGIKKYKAHKRDREILSKQI